MSWWGIQKTSGSGSSSGSGMPLLCALWLLMICLAPGGQSQRLRETGAEQPPPAASGQLAQRDALCHQKGCYAVFFQKRNFREAGRSCRERGGTLATMHTHEEAAVVHELLLAIEGTKPRLRLWIGLHRSSRQCSSTRALRGFVWVTGDQDGQFSNWLHNENPGTCTVPRCVAMNVHTSEIGRESGDNFQWVDGSCGLPLDGYVCQYSYKGMCTPLEDEGSGPALYTTPFHLLSSLLTHVPYNSMATLPCPSGGSDPEARAEQTVLCTERDDKTVGWSKDAPLCLSPPDKQDWCSQDHGCEQYCQNEDTDYYCYCSEGFVINEDGYSCKPDPLSPTDQPKLSADSAGPTDLVNEACVEMGCEYNCVETQRGVRCTCPHGYQMGPDGRKCSDVDECQQDPCSHVCVNIPGTFHCTCSSGFQQDDEGECADIDECLYPESCEGLCNNTVGSFTCTCNQGYVSDSEDKCVDRDECAEGSPCQQGCVNFVGGYLCYCDSGYNLQSDGRSCQPVADDGEYSTLTPDPEDSADMSESHPDHDILWVTPDPNFEADTNFDVGWLTEAPEAFSPDMAHGSDNHLNQWDAKSPKRYETAPPPTQQDNTGNEIHNEAEDKTEGNGDRDKGVANESASGTRQGEGSKVDTAEEAGSAAGERKHNKSWLLVALLVPLCVLLVVMLALGIVYCTSCAVDKSLSFSDCYRWILPTMPPDQRNGKTQA